jgi:hypothetical protein
VPRSPSGSLPGRASRPGSGMRAAGRAAVLTLTLLAGLALPGAGASSATVDAAAGGPAADCPGRTAEQTGATGTWTSYAAPGFPFGPAQITGHAVDPIDPRRWYVTNGLSLVSTADGGCTWSTSYELPELPTVQDPVSRRTDRIVDVVVGSHPASHDRVLLAVRSPGQLVDDLPTFTLVNPAGTTVLVRSEDAGASWSTTLLPAGAGQAGPLLTAPSDPDVVYAVAGGVLNASTDGGQTFEVRGVPSAQAGAEPSIAPGIASLAVDPLDALDLYAKDGNVVSRSRQGGRPGSWVAYPAPLRGGALYGPDLLHRPGEPARPLFVQQSFNTSPISTFHTSDDGGATFRARTTAEYGGELQGSFDAIAHGAGEDERVLTTFSPARSQFGVHAFSTATQRFVNIDEFGLGPLRDVQADRTAAPRFFFRHADGLVVYRPASRTADPVAAPPRRLVDLPPFEPPAAPLPDPAVLTPARASLRVEPGEQSSLTHALTLPARPTPLDVFFLVDTSVSMGPTIRGLAEGLDGLVRELAGAGIDAQFGLGEFADVLDKRYVRRADVQPPGPAFQDELATLFTSGGTDEPGFTALHQVATGSGLPGGTDPGGRRPQQPVEAGQQATWRDGALRVVVLVADEESFGEDPRGPGREETVTALQERGVRVVGIEVNPPLGSDVADAVGTTVPSPLRRQLEDIAGATGALAPPEGADCQGNGTREIAGGAPLVCTLASARAGEAREVAGPIRSLLLSLRDEQPVALAVADDRGLRTSVTPAADYRAVDVTEPSSQSFRTSVGCAPAQAGDVFPLELVATVGTAPVATAALLVECGDPLAPAAAPPETAEAAPVQPAPAPPALATATAPVPAAGPEPASQLAPAAPLPPPPGTVPVAAPGQAVVPGAEAGTAGAAGSAAGSVAAPGAAVGTASGTASGTVSGTSGSGAVGLAGAPSGRRGSVQEARVTLGGDGELAATALEPVTWSAGRPGPGHAPVLLLGAGIASAGALALGLDRRPGAPRAPAASARGRTARRLP